MYIFKQMMNDDVLCCSKPRTVETNRQIDIGNSNRENAAIAIKRKSTSRIRAKNKRVRRKVPDDVKSIDTASNSDSLPKLELDKTKLSTSVESTETSLGPSLLKNQGQVLAMVRKVGGTLAVRNTTA